MKPIPDHAVNRLRIWRKSVSTRPFLARGGSVPRCDACQLRHDWCACDWRPALKAEAGFCLMMYDSEPMKPSNTGRLIADVRRGVTLIEGKGWYSKKDVDLLIVLTRKYESQEVFAVIKAIDPDAVVSQTFCQGVFGEGFDKIK
jgi:DTW domain-containing protein YfiP